MPAASGPPQPGNRRSPQPPPPVPGARWRRILPGDERELRYLRRWLADLLPPCPARDDVIAVANELSSNAIRHTRSGHGGQFAVEITWCGLAVRVAVADSGAPIGPHVIDDPASEHGRGLLVVQGLAANSGVYGDEGGRLVWADIPWSYEPAVAPDALVGHDAAAHGGQVAGYARPQARRDVGIQPTDSCAAAAPSLGGQRSEAGARTARPTT